MTALQIKKKKREMATYSIKTDDRLVRFQTGVNKDLMCGIQATANDQLAIVAHDGTSRCNLGNVYNLDCSHIGNVTLSSYATTTYLSSNAISLGAGSAIGSDLIATRPWVTDQVQANDWKQEVEVLVDCTSAAITVSNPGTSSFNSITLLSGARVLLVNNGVNSGVYVFNGSGSAMVRATDCNTTEKLKGATVYVRQGTSQYTIWTCCRYATTSSPSTELSDFSTFIMDTDIPIFKQSGGGGGSLDVSANYTWTGAHTFQGSLSQGIVPSAGAPSWNSPPFAGFVGTVTDTNTTFAGIKYTALNHFAGGTVVGSHASAAYMATAIYAAAPTLSGSYHANSMRLALLTNGDTG
jgi:hypothetical protein